MLRYIALVRRSRGVMADLGIVAVGEYSDVRNIVSEKLARPEQSFLFGLFLCGLFQETRQLGGSVLLVSPGFPRVSLQPMYKDDVGNNAAVIFALVQPGQSNISDVFGR